MTDTEETTRPPMTFNDYLVWVNGQYLAQTPIRDLRLGQIFFNNLPADIREPLRGTRIDPFYKNEISVEVADYCDGFWGEPRTPPWK